MVQLTLGRYGEADGREVAFGIGVFGVVQLVKNGLIQDLVLTVSAGVGALRDDYAVVGHRDPAAVGALERRALQVLGDEDKALLGTLGVRGFGLLSIRRQLAADIALAFHDLVHVAGLLDCVPARLIEA